jgi:hypothetical protein
MALVVSSAFGCGERDLGQGEATDVAAREQAAEIARLRAAVGFAEVRARAYLGLEFLGDVPAVPSPRSGFVIEELSAIPDPATADYPDCVAVHVVRFVDGPATTGGVERALLAMTAFRDRVPAAGSTLAVGESCDAVVLPWAAMPDSVKSIQRADTTDRFDLPLFAAIAPAPRVERRTVAVRPPVGSGLSRDEAIRRDLARKREAVVAHGGWEAWRLETEPFRRELRERLAAAGGEIVEFDGQVFRAQDELAHPVDEGEGRVWPAPQVAFFESMQEQLHERGIDLVVVPMPGKGLITGLGLLDDPPDDGILDVDRERMLVSLLEAGVEVVDVLPALLAADEEDGRLYYDAVDSHPADGAIRITARVVAERLRRWRISPNLPRELRVATVPFGIPERWAEDFPPHARSPRAYTATAVESAPGHPIPWTTEGSPLLVIGDSFAAVPESYRVQGANIGSHLALELGVAPRTMTVAGGAPQMLVHLAERGAELLDGVRVCVFVFHEVYLYTHDPASRERAWQIVVI